MNTQDLVRLNRCRMPRWEVGTQQSTPKHKSNTCSSWLSITCNERFEEHALTTGASWARVAVYRLCVNSGFWSFSLRTWTVRVVVLLSDGDVTPLTSGWSSCKLVMIIVVGLDVEEGRRLGQLGSALPLRWYSKQLVRLPQSRAAWWEGAFLVIQQET